MKDTIAVVTSTAVGGTFLTASTPTGSNEIWNYAITGIITLVWQVILKLLDKKKEIRNN